MPTSPPARPPCTPAPGTPRSSPGWLSACRDAGAAWGGGESPTLAGPDRAGSGRPRRQRASDGCPPAARPARRRARARATRSSSSPRAGCTPTARRSPAGWRPSCRGRLDDTAAERPPLRRGASSTPARSTPGSSLALWADGVPVRYASHITGHGLRKLMRADRELTYRIERLPEVPEVLGFSRRRGRPRRDTGVRHLQHGRRVRGVHRRRRRRRGRRRRRRCGPPGVVGRPGRGRAAPGRARAARRDLPTRTRASALEASPGRAQSAGCARRAGQ